MEKFWQRKNEETFSTSTPKSQNAEVLSSALPASSSKDMETPPNTAADTVGLETPGQDTRARKQGGEKTTETLKQELTDEDGAKFGRILDNSVKKLNNVPFENTNYDDIESDDGDNIEAAKEWTLKQKLSFRK